MNLNSEQIWDTVAEIKKQEKILGVKIDLAPDNIWVGKQNVNFYGGFIGAITLTDRDLYLEINAVGDVIIDMYVNDEWESRFIDRTNGGRFGKETVNLIETDEQFESLQQSVPKGSGTKYVVTKSNRLEITTFRGAMDEYKTELGILVEKDSILGTKDVLEGFKDIKSMIDLINKNYRKR